MQRGGVEGWARGHGTFTALTRARGGADVHRKRHRPVIDPSSNWPPSWSEVMAAESSEKGGQDKMDAVGGKIAGEHFRGSSARITPGVSDFSWFRYEPNDL